MMSKLPKRVAKVSIWVENMWPNTLRKVTVNTTSENMARIIPVRNR